MKDTINIVYGCDDNFVSVLFVSIATLIKCNSDSLIDIYIIDDHISLGKKNIIENLSTDNQKVIWLPMKDIENKIGSKLQLDRGSLAQFARLFLNEYLPESIERVLYLDCDTMIVSSIRELWDTDLNSLTFGACLDAFSWLYNKNLGLSIEAELINSGVLLVDMVMWRSRNVENKVVEILKKRQGKIQQADQGILDIMVQNDLKVLHPKFNCISGYFEFTYPEWIKYRKPTEKYKLKYSSEIIRQSVKNPVIIHFTSSFLNDRPWSKNSTHPFKEDWLTEQSQGPLMMPSIKQTNFLKSLFNKIPRPVALSFFGILQAYLRPLIKKT